MLMKKKNPVLGAAIGSLIALGVSTAAMQSAYAAKEGMEKCYGISKAGKNDCQTASSACAGTSTADAQKDAWVYIPEGMCEKVVGGSKSAA